MKETDMQFIDLKNQQARIRQQIEQNIRAVLDHGQYIMGPEISALEMRLADYTGVSHSIGCSSGTDALLMALMACDIGPGDAVFTTPFTFFATAEAIMLLGATPIFVDIDPVSFNMAPGDLRRACEALQSGDSGGHPLPRQEGVSSLKAKGIIAVDLFGLPADYDAINEIAENFGLFVIEDAAQSFGAEYHGQKAGSLAHIACTSFFPAKPLGGYGDAGAVFTDDDELAEKMRSIRIHGQTAHQYENVRLGLNARLDSLQAAVLLAKMDIFPDELEKRQVISGRYSDALAEAADLVCPKIPEGFKSAWAQYSLLAREAAHREAIQNALKEVGIPTAVYYPKPLHLQAAMTKLKYRAGDFPVSEAISSRIFSIPMHPYLTPEDQERIVAAIRRTR